VVGGGAARLAGVVLMLPLIIGQGGGFLYGVAVGVQRAAQAGGRPMTQADIDAMKKEIEPPLLILNVAVTAGSLLAAVVIGVAGAKRPKLADAIDIDEAAARRWGPGRASQEEEGIRRREDGQPRRQRLPPDEDDRLPPRRPPKSSGSGLVWVILVGVAAVVLLGCGGGALLYFGFRGAIEKGMARTQGGPGMGGPARDTPAKQAGKGTVADFEVRVVRGGPNHIFVFVNKGQSDLQNVKVWVFLNNENNSRTSVQRFWLAWKSGEEKQVEVPDEFKVVQVALDGTAEVPGPGAPEPVAVKKQWNYDDLPKPK
jgi:hypothetical protein